jgi:hypothetical protein
MKIARSPHLLIALATVGLVACGGDDEGDDASATVDASSTVGSPSTAPSSSTPSTSTESTTPSTSAPATSTDAPPQSTVPDTPAPGGATTVPVTTSDDGTPSSEAELAASALFTLSDFDAGWTEEPYDPADDPNNDALLAQIAECSGLDINLIGSDGLLGDTKAKSGRFESPDEAVSVEQTVGFAGDEATALAAMAAIGDERLAPCYEVAIAEVFNEPGTLPEGMEVGEVSMDRVDITGVATDDAAVWYRVFVPLTYQEQNLDQHLELVFLRSGRVMTQLELLGTGAPFPDDQLDPVIELAIARAESIA